MLGCPTNDVEHSRTRSYKFLPLKMAHGSFIIQLNLRTELYRGISICVKRDRWQLDCEAEVCFIIKARGKDFPSVIDLSQVSTRYQQCRY